MTTITFSTPERPNIGAILDTPPDVVRLSTWNTDGWYVECVTTLDAIAIANAEDPALRVILDAAEQAIAFGDPVFLDFGAGGRWRFDLPTFDLPIDNPTAPTLREPPAPAIDPILQAIADLLHPASEPDRQWDADTIEVVSDLLDTHPVIGPMIAERRRAQKERTRYDIGVIGDDGEYFTFARNIPNDEDALDAAWDAACAAYPDAREIRVVPHYS